MTRTIDNGWEAEMWLRGIQAFMDYKGPIKIDGIVYHHSDSLYSDKSLLFIETIGVDLLHKWAKKFVQKKKWTDALFKEDEEGGVLEPFLKEFLQRLYDQQVRRRQRGN